jgi:hypothetical protein
MSPSKDELHRERQLRRSPQGIAAPKLHARPARVCCGRVRCSVYTAGSLDRFFPNVVRGQRLVSTQRVEFRDADQIRQQLHALVMLGGAIASVVNYHQPLFSFNTIGASLAVSGGYWAAAFVLRIVLKIDWRLRSMRYVFRLLAISLVSSCAVAFAGVLMGVADHAIKPSEYLHASITWWVGDAVRNSGIPEFMAAFLWRAPDPEKNMQGV